MLKRESTVRAKDAETKNPAKGLRWIFLFNAVKARQSSKNGWAKNFNMSGGHAKSARNVFNALT